eukprot:CAMPEP_0180626618 /NCGR_PEP_ID=MMETSP1037_2-20121125/37937_1 /TAXON_ID=632150 /ORGANISM="Azadinium spinosum, Strain 3D9" /LENGTH=162 /DNA_ID=CAMNT_0022647191 /DNA_START=85 /DNA_END=570 /DNA_ORIENTATION=-
MTLMSALQGNAASDGGESPTTEARKARNERYREKFQQAVHLRQVMLYERAWQECLRREHAATAEHAATVVEVEFRVHYDTVLGQELHLVGSPPELGAWDLWRSLSRSPGNVWLRKVKLPRAAMPIEYKYVVSEASGVRWEGGSNHVFEASTGSRVEQCDDAW